MHIRVTIFEDNTLVREGMQAILNGSTGFQCTGAYADANNLERKITSSNPDVVMMDIEMPGIDGIQATQVLKEKYPEVKILMQTVFNDSDKIFNALSAGASGYILKNDSPARQLEAIREVYNGGASMSSAVAKKVLQFFTNKNMILVSPGTDDFHLSEREKELLVWMAQGYNHKQIAGKVFLSYETVRTHVKKIYKKLHVASRAEALLRAKQQGLV